MVSALLRRAREIYRTEGLRSLVESTRVYVTKKVLRLRRIPDRVRLWIAVRRNGTPVFERDVRGSKMILDTRNRGIERGLVLDGEREVATTDFIERRLSALKQRTKGDVVVFDVGANIGYYALLEARVLGSEGAVYAFEPHPENVALLERNVEANGYENVEVIHGAVGRSEGSAELSVTKGGNTHRLSHVRGQLEVGGTITVDAYTVDGFLESLSLDREDALVVRIDVEGAEYDVFQGMSSLLESDRRALIGVELHHRALGEERFDAILDALRSNGFELEYVNASGEEVPADFPTSDDLFERSSNTQVFAYRE